MILGSEGRTKSGRLRGVFWIVTGLALGLWSQGGCVYAQLILDRPNQRWFSGQVIELYMLRQDGEEDAQLESIFFDDESIPFEVVPTRSAAEALRVRIRVPDGLKPGGHRLSAEFAEPARAPRIVGLPLDEARRALDRRGYELDTGGFQEQPSDVLSYVVARQTPRAGRPVRPGARIRVQVSTVTEVPDIASLSVEEARALLEPRGLELDTTSVSVEAPESAVRVVRYEPAAGARVESGTRIAVREFTIGVPELIGRRVENARQLLVDSGFIPLIDLHEAADGPPEVVLGQRPAAAAAAPPGTEVLLTVESRPDPAGPRWPIPEAATVAALTITLRRVRARRGLRKKYEIEIDNGLDRLREQSRAEDLEDRDLGLDLRLVGFSDPGRQTLDVDGPLVLEEVG